MKKTKFKMTGNGSGTEKSFESSCLCASVLKKDAGVVEGDFNTETQRRRGTEFKMTEIGLIPEDWEVKRIGEIGEPSMCKRVLKSQTSDSGDIPFYKIGTFGKTADAFISKELFTSYKRQYSYPKNGDVLISAAGTIGRTVVFDGNDAYFQDSNIVWIGHDERIVLNKYLKWCLEVIKWQTEDGGIVTRLYNDNIRNSLIPVPPLPEQKKIAEALSDVDELLVSMTTLIEKKRAIKQGAMQELLTGKKRLPGFGGKCRQESLETEDFNAEAQRRRGSECKMTEVGLIPVDWEVKRLGEICKIIMGQSPASVYYNIKGNGLPLIQGNADLEDRKSIIRFYTSQITKICDVGDVVLSVRAPVGAVGKAEYKSCLGRGVCALKYENDYLYQYLLFVEDKWGEFSKGSTFDSINSNELAEYKLPLPPTLAEQRAIAEVLSDMDAEIRELEAQKAKFESIKQGMMQELLTGKTRLV